MPHRTTNPLTAFYGDMRENGNPQKKERQRRRRLGTRAKDTGAEIAWEQEFPGEPLPSFYGSIFVVYKKLEEKGWVFSSRYGWRKKDD